MHLSLAAGAVLLAAAASCSDLDELYGVGGGGGAGAGGSGGAGGQGPTITISLTVEDVVTDALLEDVQICVLDIGLECVTTDASGEATLVVPASTPLWTTFEKEGYVSTLLGAVTGTEDLEQTAPMINVTLVGLVASGVDSNFDPDKGHLAMIALGHPVGDDTSFAQMPGVSFDLAPKSGTGPHYINELNVIDTDLTETGEAGGALWFDVEPGDDYILTAVHDTLPCKDFLAHPADEPNTYSVRVLAGFLTYTTVICGTPGGSGGAGGSGGIAGGGSGGS